MRDTERAWQHDTFEGVCEQCGEKAHVAIVCGTKPGGTRLCWRCAEILVKSAVPKMEDEDTNWR